MGEATKLSMTFTGSSESFWVRMLSKLMGLFMKKQMLTLLKQDLADIKQFVENKYTQ